MAYVVVFFFLIERAKNEIFFFFFFFFFNLRISSFEINFSEINYMIKISQGWFNEDENNFDTNILTSSTISATMQKKLASAWQNLQ